MTTICIKATITGKVQGVFFRKSTQTKANELHITGWVRNTTDGKVVLVACGNITAVNALIDWLWQGPPAATVSNVDWQEIPTESYQDFQLKL